MDSAEREENVVAIAILAALGVVYIIILIVEGQQELSKGRDGARCTAGARVPTAEAAMNAPFDGGRTAGAVERQGQGKVHSWSLCTNGGRSDEHAFLILISIHILMVNDSRSCRKARDGARYTAGACVPTAEAAMNAPFDCGFY